MPPVGWKGIAAVAGGARSAAAYHEARAAGMYGEPGHLNQRQFGGYQRPQQEWGPPPRYGRRYERTLQAGGKADWKAPSDWTSPAPVAGAGSQRQYTEYQQYRQGHPHFRRMAKILGWDR